MKSCNCCEKLQPGHKKTFTLVCLKYSGSLPYRLIKMIRSEKNCMPRLVYVPRARRLTITTPCVSKLAVRNIDSIVLRVCLRAMFVARSLRWQRLHEFLGGVEPTRRIVGRCQVPGVLQELCRRASTQEAHADSRRKGSLRD